MPNSVAAIIATEEITEEELRRLATKTLKDLAEKYHLTSSDGTKRVPVITASVGWKEGEEFELNVFARTKYRTEWTEIKRELRNAFLLGVLVQFEGKENIPIPMAQLEPISDPPDVAARINQQLTRIGRASKNFSWQMECDSASRIMKLTTKTVR